MNKKVLVLGATGAMGQYLVPVLAEKGYQINAVSLDQPDFQFPNVRNICGNAKDWALLEELFQTHYDGVIDFLTYPTAEAYTAATSEHHTWGDRSII